MRTKALGSKWLFTVENHSGLEGNDLDPVGFRPVGDDFTAGGTKSVQCCAKLAIPDREQGTMVSPLSVEIEIESCLDSPLT